MFLPWYVPADIRAATLGVGHLAKNPAAGAGDPLNREKRPVRIVRNVHSGSSLWIAILSCDLASGGEFEDLLGRGVKLTLTMRYRDAMEVIDLAAAEPGREIGGDPSGHIAGDMAPDIVEGESGGIRFGIPYLAIRHEAGLNQGLEAITDSEGQPIPFGQEFHDRITDD